MSRIHQTTQEAQQDSLMPPTIIVALPEIAEEIDGRFQPRTNVDRSLSTATRATARNADGNTAFDIFEPLRILLRRRLCLYIAVPAFVILAVLVSVLMPAKYIATSRLQLVTEQTGRLSVGDSASANADIFNSFAALQTDVTLMQSDRLALQVIRELNLANTNEFAYKPLMQTAETRRQMALPIDQAPLKRAAILAKFNSSLSIEILPGSRLIAVYFSSSNPQLAALIVNRLVSDFVDYDFTVRYNATIKATDFLSRQLVELKSEVERSQQRAIELQRASGMFGTDQHSLIDNRVEQLNNELIAAEANRVEKQTLYNLARSGNPEVIAGLLGTSSTSGGTRSAQNWMPLISHLRQEQADLNVQYAQAATEYGSEYPRLIQIKDQMQALQSTIQAELGKVLESAKGEYELAVSQEDAARRGLAEQQAIASQMKDRAIAYNIAKNEADSSRVLYENLLQKVKEAEVLAGLRSSRLNVVDPAAVPGSPAKPRLRTFLAVGLLGGIVIGILGAFVVEATDHTVRTPQEIENATRFPLVGVIPQDKLSSASESRKLLEAYATKNGTRVLAATVAAPVQDENVVAQAFRSVRTSLALQGRGRIARTLLIASASANEGKSFTALNLAAALAENGSKVLLVDADLRRGKLSKTLDRQSEKGLSEVLSGLADRVPYGQVDAVSGLAFMPAGALLKSPPELLASATMLKIMQEWRREFTHVVIDTPPLLPVIDAVILSQQVDSVIVVARSAFTQRTSILRAIRLLRNAGVTHINMLANAVEASSPEYSQVYGRY
jgi:polysaccharide biosynthesis transport protein